VTTARAGLESVLEADDELPLAAAPCEAERAEALEERHDPRVVAADRCDELGDTGRTGIRRELVREDRADAAALVLVRDCERD